MVPPGRSLPSSYAGGRAGATGPARRPPPARLLRPPTDNGGVTDDLVIAGASGVVGRHLVAAARAAGRRVRLLSRSPAGPDARRWDPGRAAAGDEAAVAAVASALEGAAVVVNLAGASLAEGRLGRAHRARVLGSRLDATRALVRAFARCQAPPPVWLQASATGFYGDTGEADVTEEAPPGRLFLSEVCARWEAAAAEALAAPAPPRLVVLRIGLVLAADAPAWAKLVGPIRLGVGGPLGGGRQWWAWIDAEDLSRAALHLLARDDARGAFNLTAPEPVRQGDLVAQAALLLGRPAFLPAPAFALRLALGGVADELLLPSCRALPARLEALGFRFDRGRVDQVLVHLV